MPRPIRLTTLLCLILLLSSCKTDPEGTVHIDDFSPVGEVQQGTNFTIEFSKPVVSDSLVGQSPSDDLLSFDPPLAGRAEWIANDRLRFFPEQLLAPSTSYEVNIKSGPVGSAGLRVRGESRFEIRTRPIRVVSASAVFSYDAGNQETARLISSLEFNYPVEPEEAAKHLELRRKEGGSIPYELETTEASKIIKLVATGVERSEEGHEVELVVSSGLVPVGGSERLATDFVHPVAVPGANDLKIERVSTEQQGNDRMAVRVALNIPVRADMVGDLIEVEPAVDYTVTSSHRYLRLQGPFKRDASYKVTVKKGLTAVDGSQLGRDYTGNVRFLASDIDPQIDFTGNGYYMTRSGNLNLGLSTINVGRVRVQIQKVFANNLVYLLNASQLRHSDDYYGDYQVQQNMSGLGTRINSFELEVGRAANEEVVTPLALESYVTPEHRGVFRIEAMESERYWNSSTRYVVATDIGMVTKRTDSAIWVWLNDLQSLDPIANATISLYSQANQLLASGTSGIDGLLVLEDLDTRLDGQSPFVLVAEKGDDMSFVQLQGGQRLSTSTFDVGGLDYLKGGYDAFVYRERGVYRPGETAHLAAIVRGAGTTVPEPFPLRLTVSAPDGRVLEERRSTMDQQGMVSYEIDIPEYALTGGYSATLSIGEDNTIGQTRFSVEEFIPDRMKVNLSTTREVYSPGDQVAINVQGLTLFGPPAAGRQVSGSVEIEPFPFSLTRWSNFTFGNDANDFPAQRIELASARLDQNGDHTYTLDLPKTLRPPSALRAVIAATVLEPGGRGVSAYRGVVIHPTSSYVGVRRTEEGYGSPGKAMPFEAIVVDPEGELLGNHTVEAKLYHIVYNSILKEVNGRYRYVSNKSEQLVEELAISSAGEPVAFEMTPPDYGSYRVVVRDVDTGATSATEFYASGWGYAPWAMDAPERIELDMDKDIYEPGETARVQVRAPFSGKMLVTVERDEILHQQIVTLDENTAVVDVPIEARYRPNVYVSAHLIRSTNDLERDASVRAFGIAPIKIDTKDYEAAVTIQTPDVIRPKEQLTVDFQVDGAQGSRPVATVAIVDEGILQLTDFQSPNPVDHFFGKKRLSVDSFDLYGDLLPEVAPSLSSPAGDVETKRKRQLSPATARRVKPVAFWSGLVETDRSGKGSVTIDVPEFNGTVRVMVVASAGGRFGHNSSEVIVRDPIVLTPTVARFLGTDDQFEIPVSVFNGTGRADNIAVNVEVDGAVELVGPAAKTIRVLENQEAVVYFAARSRPSGDKATISVAASGGGVTTRSSIDLPVRAPAPVVTRSGSGSVAPGESQTVEIPADLVAGSDRYTLSVSGLPDLQLAGNLQNLLRYPHGCVEQTTSRLFAMLYYDEMAEKLDPGIVSAGGADYYLEEGITKLERLQQFSGAFTYWPNSTYVNNWSSIYASHFLVEARKKGYVVSDGVYEKMLMALNSMAKSYRGAEAHRFESVAYASYVLALAGEADRGTLNFLKDTALNDLSPISRYQLAGAMALLGDTEGGLQLIPQTIPPTRRETGGNFNSEKRSRGLMLSVLADIDVNHPMVPQLVNWLSQRYKESGTWTTQENAFALLGLGKALGKTTTGSISGNVTAGTRPLGAFGNEGLTYTSDDWAGETIQINSDGSGTVFYYWSADGVPSGPVPEFDKDIRVRRRFLRENGSPIPNLNNIQQGEVLIAEISLQSVGSRVEQVAVVDMLPAGLEIENVRLESRESVSWIDDKSMVPDHVDIRDDRLVFYATAEQRSNRSFYYAVRAVTEGTFALPPVRAEAMYAPEISSISSSGRLTVVKPQ